jgi:chaperonin GroES
MAVKLQPMGDRLVVKPMTEDGKTRITPDVEVGDIVIYTKYGGSEIKIDGEEFIIMRESDILAKKPKK